MKAAALLMGLLGSTPALAGRPELGRFDHAEAMLAVPKGWLIATGESDDNGGVAEVRHSQSRLSPVVMLQWGDAGERTTDAIIDDRVSRLSKEMAIGSASETTRVDFGEGGRRATLEAGMMGVTVPIEVAARVVGGRYMVAVFTGPPSTHGELGAPEMIEEMLTRSIWSGEVPALKPEHIGK
ncbi:MAG: hypothetical protein EP330_24915 [Deltaproteobacteria bacterium]|nr:MAG: hypothetical protein EP330_24915 [Deltaproteobacteria bacterium]